VTAIIQRDERIARSPKVCHNRDNHDFGAKLLCGSDDCDPAVQIIFVPLCLAANLVRAHSKPATKRDRKTQEHGRLSNRHNRSDEILRKGSCLYYLVVHQHCRIHAADGCFRILLGKNLPAFWFMSNILELTTSVLKSNDACKTHRELERNVGKGKLKRNSFPLSARNLANSDYR
jgi:hypothetical protein